MSIVLYAVGGERKSSPRYIYPAEAGINILLSPRVNLLAASYRDEPKYTHKAYANERDAAGKQRCARTYKKALATRKKL